MFVFLLQANINEKLIQKIVELKLLKNDPEGKIGKNVLKTKTKHPICKVFLVFKISLKTLNKIKKNKNVRNRRPTIPCSDKNSKYI